MMFLQVTPDTTGYMILGYAVILGVLALYVISLAVRQRNARKDWEMLKELEKKEKRK